MKKFIFGIMLSIAFIAIVGLFAYKYYVILQAYHYNQKINVAGVTFLMTEERLSNTLQNGEFVYGMGGNGWRFSDEKIFVMTSSVGLFRDKVCLIETENANHHILGIRVGQDFNNAVHNLTKQGFKEISDSYFEKGNVTIYLTGASMIQKIRINIQDPAYKDVVF